VSEETVGEDVPDAAHEPRECMPCAGSGQVISNLGGSTSKIACPWCEGKGIRPQSIDAQARWARDPAAESDAQGSDVSPES